MSVRVTMRLPLPPIGGRVPAFALLVLLWASAPAAAQSVLGQVMEEGDDSPVAQARVTLLDAEGDPAATATSDAEGEFSIEAPEPGEYTLRIEHLSFAPFGTPVLRLNRGEATLVEIRLTVQAIALEPLTVVGRRQVGNPRLREFYDRAERNRRSGSGRIFFREDVQRAHSVSHLLFTVPVRRDARGTPCQMDYYLDGARLFPEENLDHLSTNEQIEGVEVYRGWSEIPPRYSSAGTCGVVLVWSRTPVGRPFTWKRALAAAVIGVLMLFAY